jgi:hypothetical protein
MHSDSGGHGVKGDHLMNYESNEYAWILLADSCAAVGDFTESYSPDHYIPIPSITSSRLNIHVGTPVFQLMIEGTDFFPFLFFLDFQSSRGKILFRISPQSETYIYLGSDSINLPDGLQSMIGDITVTSSGL